MPAWLVTVAPDAARRWAAGGLSDSKIILDHTRTEPPWGLFVATLPSLAEWRTVVRWTARHAAGASCLILRTGNPVVERYVQRWGGTPTFRESAGQTRFLASPHILARWFSRPAVNHSARQPRPLPQTHKSPPMVRCITESPSELFDLAAVL